MGNRFLLAAAVSISMAAGCATSFSGDAHVAGGVAGCEAKCKAWGLEFAGMVAMGEYSDACICRRPGEKTLLGDAASAAGSVAGTVMHMERAEDQRQHETLIH
jgi:hypothetical protein